MITSPPSEIIIAYLVAEGLVQRPSNPSKVWPATRGQAPISDTISATDTTYQGDKWVYCTDILPFTEGKYQRTGETVRKPKVQICVRDKDYQTAYLKCRAIEFALSPILLEIVTTDTDEEILFEACKIDLATAFLYSEAQNRRQYFCTTVQLTISEAP